MEQTEYTLGLDLGVSSIGFAVVRSVDEKPGEILKMGVRIIPLSKDDETEFTQGNAISKNRSRTLRRTQRKGLDRYQLRRKALIAVLNAFNMMPDRHLLFELSPLEIWGLRAKAVTEKVTLQELGRILLHLNQKRGYKHSKSDETDDKKQTEYVQQVNERFARIKDSGETIGQHFYSQLKQYFSVAKKTAPAYRIKEKVFPRAAYTDEFDAIWKRQQQEYPSILTSELYKQIRNEIIYYQRRLKSQKGLVNFCEFESKPYTTAAGKSIEAGPKVAPRSSPLFQIEKIWESVNNIIIRNRKGEQFEITASKRQTIFDHLNNNDKLTQPELFKILGIGRNDGYFTNDLIRKKGIQGNQTRLAFTKVLGSEHPAVQMDLKISYWQNVDPETGEVVERPIVDASFEKEPLFRLWHIIYSLDEDSGQKKLVKEFGFDEAIARKLLAIDLTTGGFGNKSARAMRKILPHLMNGLTYDKACALAGYNHSDSLTKEENEIRHLDEKLCLLPKNSLRQPVVEKILNQLVNLVNAIIDQYGKPTSIRVELARELRQSREERNEAYNNINKRERDNKKIVERLFELPYFQQKKSVSKRDIEKYRLWEEFSGISPYEPGKTISLTELYSHNYDIEHILPRALRFDDSFGNKTICPRRFNSGENAKNRSTAYEYMQNKRSREDLESYLSLLESAYKDRKISKSKYEKLLMKETDIPTDFINRQLNDTRYISRKAMELLSKICRKVYSTSGSVTQRLRSLWGWDDILEQLNLPKYQQVGLTEEKQVTHNGQTHMITKIKNWTKRDDHRHHAIDALAVACTRQRFITRINELNSQHTRDEMRSELAGTENEKKLSNLLENYLLLYKPFDTSEVARHCNEIHISFKPGKKVATYSVRKIKKGGRKEPIQKHILTPRGPLSEESVYGKIKRKITKTVKLDKNFDATESIINENIKKVVTERLSRFGNDATKAFSNLKKDPIWVDDSQAASISHVDVIEYVEEYVIKYDIGAITAKDVQHVVDKQIRQILADRLKQYGDNHKEAFKTTVWLNEEKKIPIKRVRCFTGLKSDSVVPIKVADRSWGIEYEKYVKPGNNHHIAIYKDANGNLQEHVVSLWHAVERKKYGLPVVIKAPSAVWSDILNQREFPDSFLENLPLDGWVFQTSMQQNECFVFNMQREELEDVIHKRRYNDLAPNIFRVRKLTAGAYWFNQQFETTPRESMEDKRSGRCIQASLVSMRGIKVRINILGEVLLDQ